MAVLTVSNDLNIAIKEFRKRFQHDNASAEVLWEMIRAVDDARAAHQPEIQVVEKAIN